MFEFVRVCRSSIDFDQVRLPTFLPSEPIGVSPCTLRYIAFEPRSQNDALAVFGAPYRLVPSERDIEFDSGLLTTDNADEH